MRWEDACGMPWFRASTFVMMLKSSAERDVIPDWKSRFCRFWLSVSDCCCCCCCPLNASGWDGRNGACCCCGGGPPLSPKLPVNGGSCRKTRLRCWSGRHLDSRLLLLLLLLGWLLGLEVDSFLEGKLLLHRDRDRFAARQADARAWVGGTGWSGASSGTAGAAGSITGEGLKSVPVAGCCCCCFGGVCSSGITFRGTPSWSCCTVKAATSGAWNIFTSSDLTCSMFSPSSLWVGAGVVGTGERVVDTGSGCWVVLVGATVVPGWLSEPPTGTISFSDSSFGRTGDAFGFAMMIVLMISFASADPIATAPVSRCSTSPSIVSSSRAFATYVWKLGTGGAGAPSATVLSSSSSSRMVVAKFSSVVFASPSCCCCCCWSCFSSSWRSFRWRSARSSALRRAGSMLSFRSAVPSSFAATARRAAASSTIARNSRRHS
uniref:Uncharacterized protein n=1 Tax=Anopheles melas TaxID=34690 RepID=A0A182U8B3_9DIPT